MPHGRTSTASGLEEKQNVFLAEPAGCPGLKVVSHSIYTNNVTLPITLLHNYHLSSFVLMNHDIDLVAIGNLPPGWWSQLYSIEVSLDPNRPVSHTKVLLGFKQFHATITGR